MSSCLSWRFLLYLKPWHNTPACRWITGKNECMPLMSLLFCSFSLWCSGSIWFPLTIEKQCCWMDGGPCCQWLNRLSRFIIIQQWPLDLLQPTVFCFLFNTQIQVQKNYRPILWIGSGKGETRGSSNKWTFTKGMGRSAKIKTLLERVQITQEASISTVVNKMSIMNTLFNTKLSRLLQIKYLVKTNVKNVFMVF